MPKFSAGIPRAAVLLLAMATFAWVTPQTLARGPDLCLWRHLFHLSSCPACGTLRALAAFFHGHFAQALAFNRNVVITAPSVAALLAIDALRAGKRRLKLGSHLEFPSQKP